MQIRKESLRLLRVLQYAPPRPDIDIKGQDPQANDMSSDQASSSATNLE